jgi:hypothetical protein
MSSSSNVPDPIAAAALRCYETFRGDSIAFEHEGKLCFGPSEKLCAFFSGSNESFLVGETTQAAIAQQRARAGQNPCRSAIPGSDSDSLAQTRNRWQAERSAGQWAPEYIRKQLEDLRSRTGQE